MFNHEHSSTYSGGDGHSLKWLEKKNIKLLIAATSVEEEMDRIGNRAEGGKQL